MKKYNYEILIEHSKHKFYKRLLHRGVMEPRKPETEGIAQNSVEADMFYPWIFLHWKVWMKPHIQITIKVFNCF